MKTKKKLIFSLLYILLFLASCECINTICYDSVGFTLIDKTSKKDLIFGNNPVYFKDSLFTKTKPYLNLQHVIGLDSVTLTLPNTDTVYLYLNSIDVDTVIINYSTSGKTYCCKNGFATPNSVVYNGKLANKVGNRFLFEK